MTDYKFQRIPDKEVQDWALYGSHSVKQMAMELLQMRQCVGAAEAQATALHKIIMDIIHDFGGPQSISDFSAWVRGELRKREVKP